MQDDLISVIVPVYKVEEYLDRCVNSIVNQTYKNLEIILVDDGSPDNCPEMCDEWAKKDQRIKVIHKQNGGLSDARNAGIEIATGEYIGFVDSDDWVNYNFIRFLYDTIKKTGCNLSACKVKEISENIVADYTTESPNCFVYTAKQVLGNCNKEIRAVVCNKLYSKMLLQDEKFEVGKLSEDEFFTFRIVDKAKNVAYVDMPMYYYFQRAGSIMNSFSIGRLDALEAYINRLKLYTEKYPELVAKEKISICIACANFYCNTLSFLKRQDKQKGKKIIKQCRSKIVFTKEEWSSYSLKEKMYAFLTKKSTIGLFCRLRNTRGIK